MTDSIKNIQTCAKTDIGFNRENNEDSFLVIDNSTELYDVELCGRMYVLADGMGGHAGGEIASQMACEGMVDYYFKQADNHSGSNYFKEKIRHLQSTLYDVHNSIIDYSHANKEYDGMGTTLSVLLLLKNKALIGHVGDSRIYRLRRDHLEQLTEDHTFAQAFLHKGFMTSEEASRHPTRHVMTQAVGRGIENIFHKVENVKGGDIFLLCSDGLYDMLSDIETKEILMENPKVSDQCDCLVARALDKGGKDNVTVIVIHV
jgi:serine/threonine protein phosphatase PrpC